MVIVHASPCAATVPSSVAPSKSVTVVSAAVVPLTVIDAWSSTAFSAGETITGAGGSWVSTTTVRVPVTCFVGLAGTPVNVTSACAAGTNTNRATRAATTKRITSS